MFATRSKVIERAIADLKLKGQIIETDTLLEIFSSSDKINLQPCIVNKSQESLVLKASNIGVHETDGDLEDNNIMTDGYHNTTDTHSNTWTWMDRKCKRAMSNTVVDIEDSKKRK